MECILRFFNIPLKLYAYIFLNLAGAVVEESSWKLYQKWCKMPERIRNAWIAAGGAVMSYTTFGNKQVTPSSPPSTSPPPLHNVYPKVILSLRIFVGLFHYLKFEMRTVLSHITQ